jgi:hypothetical protein
MHEIGCSGYASYMGSIVTTAFRLPHDSNPIGPARVALIRVPVADPVWDEQRERLGGSGIAVEVRLATHGSEAAVFGGGMTPSGQADRGM